MFDRFRPLEVLNLGHNELIKISEYALAGLTALTVLNLNHNHLAELSEHHLMNLSALKELDLSWNDLKYLPSHLFRNITGLESLSLSGNIRLTQYIHESPDALKDVLQRGLRRLKLNHLELVDLPENLFNLAYNLEELYITNNYFTKLPDLYVGSLKRLDVSGSNISVLQTGNFLYLPSLEVLHMNRMKLLTRVVEGAFVGLKHLQELYMEKCLNLTSFDGMAFGGPTYNPPPLRNFSLKHSGLQTLSKKLFPVFSDIQHLKLQGNPWDCDCRLRWFKEMNFSKEIEHVRCYFPQSLHNRTIASLERSDFVCMTKKTRVLYGLMISMAVLFGLIALLAIVASFDSLRGKCCGQQISHRIRYDPMLVQLHPNNAENYGEDYEGPNSISFISRVR
ncbi:Chaoptin [Gryllus bimaculatus]|nr:Chaoptin [Gryllus bimaculatus]